jgi:HlyD family secretion protein
MPTILREPFIRSAVLTAISAGLIAAAGCRRSETGKDQAKQEDGKTTSRIISPRRGDLRVVVVQPGTVQAFESTPIYPRIAGYAEKYRVDIGKRVNQGDILLDMWIPDYDEALKQKVAATHRADVQIGVAQAALLAAESTVETAKARLASAKAGVNRAQAAYVRWESEYKRLQGLVAERVLNEQVRDETYRQFEEAVAVRDQATAAVAEATANVSKVIADRDRAKVDVEAARADLLVAQAEQSQARVVVEYGHIKASYPGIITQRNVSPGDYLQAGIGTSNRPLFVLEQTDPVRVFVGVPELAAGFIREGDIATIRFQAIQGVTRTGKIVRTGFSLNPTSRTLQTEIDIPNPTGLLRPGMYVTSTIAIDRHNVFILPSDAISFQGGQNYFLYFEGKDGKPVRTQILVGLSTDDQTEVLRKRVPNSGPDDWSEFDGTERIFSGNLDALKAATAPDSSSPDTSAPAQPAPPPTSASGSGVKTGPAGL